MTLATTAGAQLTADLKPQLKALVEDMRTRLDDDSERSAQWRATHQKAVSEQRTASSWTDYVEDQLTQAAVGWLLTSVFVRFCEDNLLLGQTAVWISGPTPTLRQRARDAEDQFYREDPANRSYREWLEQAFDALRQNPGTKSLLDDHAAIEIIEPSSFAVEKLFEYWRRTDDEGELVWRFDDPELSTRFLGDLYQDLSDYAKKKYALLQTPEFVEEFILDQTMEPALKERPLEGFTVIDPTCGSGHFLLGAFHRLVQRWQDEAPGMEPRARVNKALESVGGVDINPFAVAIAKFRLIVAAMKASGDSSLVNVPKYTLNLAAGDSLLFGPEKGGQEAFESDGGFIDADEVASGFAYSTEDRKLLKEILRLGKYDVVVGNPPYITVKDKTLNARYRQRYSYCKGKYALTVPFMERFFNLARRGGRPGWVGQITSNSFMKREFGVPLIEDFLGCKDLRLIVDSSGAYIPGHGTPTVIVVGRNMESASSPRAVLGIQGEPGVPEDPAQGKVWRSITSNVDDVGYEDPWISVVDLPRDDVAKHPWSLSGGGAVETLRCVDSAAMSFVRDDVRRIGFFGVMGADGAMTLPPSAVSRLNLESDFYRRLVVGDEVRDFEIHSGESAWFPYDQNHELRNPFVEAPNSARLLWSNRTEIGNRATFTKGTYFSDGRPWYEWHQLPKDPSDLSIAFAFVSTHNHFVLDRGGKVFNRSAPVIKLPEGASEEDHLRLLGVLNSSTACFWLKQNSHGKGVGGVNQESRSERWDEFFEFTGTTLKDFPLINDMPVGRARKIDELAVKARTLEPDSVVAGGGSLSERLRDAELAYRSVRAQMIAEQEELDWEVYYLYGVIDEDLSAPTEAVSPPVDLGQRAFEIALARRIAAGETQTAWFSRHRSTPTTEIPAQWPAEYRDRVSRRLEAIESNRFIRLLERQEYKRRWSDEEWETKVQRALLDWLLDKLENPKLWVNQSGIAQPRSVGEIAGVVAREAEFVEALDLWAGQKDAPVAETLEKLLADQVVPYLAAYRYKESGMRKRAEWESVWELQRAEDRGEVKATDIPVPPKYATADFRRQSYWSHRGKLDVPKERFILYPDANRDTDTTSLIGWAGWNHAQQGLALANIYAMREAEGVDTSKLVPLVAGMAEVLPWVKQWHSGPDQQLGIDLAEYLEAQLQEKSQQVGVPVAELSQWRPPAPTRGRKKKAGA